MSCKCEPKHRAASTSAGRTTGLRVARLLAQTIARAASSGRRRIVAGPSLRAGSARGRAGTPAAPAAIVGAHAVSSSAVKGLGQTRRATQGNVCRRARRAAVRAGSGAAGAGNRIGTAASLGGAAVARRDAANRACRREVALLTAAVGGQT
jgi:hypothetical protein